jgi:hypothetical protein
MAELFDDPTMTGQKRRQLNPGDVLMVERNVKPTDGRKPFIWKLFLVVEVHKKWIVRGWVLGGNGYYAENPMTIEIGSSKVKSMYFLPMEEWPAGVHVFRMAQIMKGRIEDL